MKKVAVIAGGYSGENVISLKSADTIMNHLDRSLYVPILVEISKGGWIVHHEGRRFAVDLNDFSFTTERGKVKFDCAFIIVHGTPGEDGRLQGYLDMVGVPHSTGSALNMAVTFNKGTTQRLLRSYGFNVTEFVLLRKGENVKPEYILSKVGLPCFVKPAQAGSSLGVSKVKEESELLPAIDKVLAVDDQIIIESFLDGREITCGVYRLDGQVTALPVTEVISKNEFFDFEAKYNDDATEEITPAQISEQLYIQCQSLTEQIYQVMQCKGLVRVDYFLCEDELYVVEVNGVPGMSEASIVPKMIRASGTDISAVLTAALEEQ